MTNSAILLGSKPGAVVALMLLRMHGWEVKEVVASSGQGEWIPGPSLYQAAKKLGIRTVEKQNQIKAEGADLVISYMYRDLVTPKTLSRGKYPLNFHAGPLPEYAGWAFYNVAILEGATEYGCTCHVMSESFDTGPLVKVRRFGINSKCETALSLERKAQLEMLLLFEEIISLYEVSSELSVKEQDANKMRYMNADEFSRLKEIPYSATEEEIDRIARAFWYPPYGVAYLRTASGAKVEVIPEIVKRGLAHRLHQDDLSVALRMFGLSIIE